MKFQPPENQNYCATVVRIKNVTPLQNCDNLVGTTIFGFQAIISKDTEVGTLGIVFPVETQLSEEFCVENNLFRHEEYNKDPMQKGYLEDNRRIKAIKFRGNTSNALFMPLESVKYALENYEDLREGDEFDKIGDKEICKKYTLPVKWIRGAAYTIAIPKRVDTKHFPEHYGTEHYFKNDRNIEDRKPVIITQKLHGTSIRIANTIVNRKLSLVDRIAQWLGVQTQKTEYDYVFGSRKVVKDVNNPGQQHYYESDIWTTEGKKLEGVIPENFIVYGELIGWTAEGAPIQSGYTYCLPEKTCRLYVYRVAFVNERGLVVDLSWDQVKEFCAERNLSVVPELIRGPHKEIGASVGSFLDKRLKDQYDMALPLDPDVVDEGVCIRIDGIVPKIYKAKSPLFLEHETKLLDKGQEDLESQASKVIEGYEQEALDQ